MNSKRVLLALLILALAVVSPGCDSSDPVASEGSSITVSANPKNIPQPLALTLQFPSTISAIVLSSSGIRQEGVEVIFTADEGCFDLEDADPTCLQLGGEGDSIEIALTNGDGIATANLFTLVGTTVQAQSGSAIDTETVTVGGQQVVTDVDLLALDNTEEVARDTVVGFRVTVSDSDGLVVPNAEVILDIEPPSGAISDFPLGTATGTDGRLEFDVEVKDSFSIRAQVAGVFSNTIDVTVRP